MRADAGTIRRGMLQALIVIVRDADENTDVRAFVEVQHEARILNGFVGCFEQQALLWIYVRRLTRRDAEELGIKLINTINEAPALGDGLADDARLRIVKALHIPAVSRHLTHGIAAFLKQSPERLGVVHTTRETAADSDDGDAFLVEVRGRGRRGMLKCRHG